MKQFLVCLMALLLCGSIYAQGSAPAAPSPFKSTGSSIYNAVSPSTFFWNLGNSGLYDTLRLWSFGGFKFLSPYGSAPSKWYIGASGAEWDKIYVDTLRLTPTSGRLYIDGDYFYRLDGEGLEASGGLTSELRSVLGRDISSPEIVDTTIQPVDLSDTATTWEFEQAYKADATDTVATDSAYATLRYSRIWIGGKPLSGANPSDNYIPKYDAALDSIMWEADAGATSGDDIKIDSNGSTADGVWDAPSGTVIQFGTGLAATRLGSDTISVSATAGAAIELDGDTTSSGTFNFTDSRIDSVNYLDVDTVHADNVVVTPKVDSVSEIFSQENQNMIIKTVGSHPSNTGVWMQYGSTHGTRFFENTTQTLSIDGDSVIGNISGGNILKGFKWGDFDSVSIGAVTLGGYVSGVLNPAMAARNVRDSLANYVLKTNENWLDISSDAAIRHYSGLNATDELIRMTRTLNGDDTTTQTVLSGNLKLESPLSVSIVGGPGNPTLDDTLNMNGYNIYGISRAEGDTADFTTYLNVPGLEGMTDSIAAVRTDLDSLNADVAANYSTPASVSSLINDSLNDHKWAAPFAVASWVKPLTDSIYLLDHVVLDRGSATPEQVLVLDSAGDIDVSSGSKKDTVFLKFIAQEDCVLDSIWMSYKVVGTGTLIDSIAVMGPRRAAAAGAKNKSDENFDGFGTDRTSTSDADLRFTLTTPIVAYAGEIFTIVLINTFAEDNAQVIVHHAMLGWK